MLRCREDELRQGLWQARFLANTAYCYRLCEGFVAETLQALERERREARRSRYGRGERGGGVATVEERGSCNLVQSH